MDAKIAYRTTRLTGETPFHRLAVALRVSDKARLDFPDVHKRAKDVLLETFASGPHDVIPDSRHAEVEEALALARTYGIQTVRLPPGFYRITCPYWSLPL